jgi:hypothetical protein
MRSLVSGFLSLLIVAFVPAPAGAARLASTDLVSTEAVLRWINAYRKHPDPAHVAAAMRALSRLGAFNNPENAGVYVGFLAGVLAKNPRQAENIIAGTLSMREEDRWVVVRAIAYSELPGWQTLLRHFAPRMQRYAALSERYISGKMARLAQFSVPPSPSALERMRSQLHLDKLFGKKPERIVLKPSPEVLDALWGYYFATGDYGPVMHIIAMLPLSTDHNDADRLTIGSMAKYTLASNAMHDQRLLALLKASRKARGESKATIAVLDEVIDGAETVDTARIRKEALATVAELRSKGPAFKRNVSWWGYLGQSAIAGGCIAAATAGMVALGLPCVIGGVASSAAVNFWNNSP